MARTRSNIEPRHNRPALVIREKSWWASLVTLVRKMVGMPCKLQKTMSFPHLYTKGPSLVSHRRIPEYSTLFQFNAYALHIYLYCIKPILELVIHITYTIGSITFGLQMANVCKHFHGHHSMLHYLLQHHAALRLNQRASSGPVSADNSGIAT